MRVVPRSPFLVLLACLAALTAGCAASPDGDQASSAAPSAAGSSASAGVVLGWSRGDATRVDLPASALAPLNRAAGARSSSATAAGGHRRVLVNFWESSCGPCVREMPLLQRLQRTGEVSVMGVTRDESRQAATALLRETRVSYANWLDPAGRYVGRFRRSIPVAAVPSSVLVVDGRIARVHIGPFRSWRDLRSGLTTGS
jgi:thiol-disulfide isomerase/thioredoxin